MEIDLKNINEFIKKERERQHLTKKELGDKSGVSPNTLCIYETHDMYPDFKVFMQILNGLGFSTKIEIRPLENGEKVYKQSCYGCVFKEGRYCSKQEKLISRIHDCPYLMD